MDGSLFDEAKSFARRTGFGIVVVSASGDLIGFGSGIPPHWVVDAAGAELWAMLTVLRLNAFMPDVVTDCKGILDTLYGSPAEACGPKRSLARTWRMVADALDGQFRDAADKLVWMPSHESALSFSSARDSRGLAVTSVMWRANRLADVLAKAAASGNRLPTWATKLVTAAASLVKHRAARLGVATYRANHYSVEALNHEGVLVKKVLRDSTAERPQWRKKKRTSTETEQLAVAPPLQTPLTAPKFFERPCKVAARAAPTEPSALARKRKATLDAHTLREQAADEDKVARLLASRNLSPAVAGTSAQQRLEQLRGRLINKQWAPDVTSSMQNGGGI